MLHPLVILFIGIAAVVVMIAVLRFNAFVALIASAMLVSLLSPGAATEKISRVATAFGNSAAAIGIVIAMAAIIGLDDYSDLSEKLPLRKDSIISIYQDKADHYSIKNDGVHTCS